MISLESVEKSILELEASDTSFSVCERLACLYTVRDHLRGYSVESQKPLQLRGKSELLQAADSKSADAVWAVIDEHMEAIRALYPSEYAAVVRKIREAPAPEPAIKR